VPPGHLPSVASNNRPGRKLPFERYGRVCGTRGRQVMENHADDAALVPLKQIARIKGPPTARSTSE
jgi:hypothetical protein